MDRNANFITVVDTGERPDAEIHMAAWDENDGLATTVNLEGTLGNHMSMVCALVENMIGTLKEHGGTVGVATFIHALAVIIAQNAGRAPLDLLTSNLNLDELFGDPDEGSDD